MKKQNTEAVIREMSEDELKLVITWAEAEGWNPGKFDSRSYFALDQKGHFLLQVGQTPIGAISVVRYDNYLSFIGLFIVRPEYRSKGYGKLLWDHAMRQIEGIKKTGLYAVPKEIPRYQKAGFKDRYHNFRYHQVSSQNIENSSHLSVRIKSSASFFENLCDYDQLYFGHSRKNFFESLFKMPQTWAFVSLSNKKVNGYGVIRPCKIGYRIGPLYCDNIETAKDIFRMLLTNIPGQNYIVDIPSTNTFGEVFANYFNLDRVPDSDTAAMFKGADPTEIDQSKCYGVCSLEFG